MLFRLPIGHERPGENVKSPQELTELLHQRGLKVTPQRYRIFQALASESHPTAEAIHRALRPDMPTTSLKTVYQALNELVELGQIRRLDLGVSARRFDPIVTPHHHLVCLRCERVWHTPADYLRLPGMLPGFTVKEIEVVFRGLCDECRAAGAAAEVAEPGRRIVSSGATPRT